MLEKIRIFSIFVIVYIVFITSITAEFTNWDDQSIIVNNKTLQDFKNAPALFIPHAGSTYQPMRNFSYMIDYQLWGHWPGGYFLQNMFWHALAAVFLYLSLSMILDRMKKPQTD